MPAQFTCDCGLTIHHCSYIHHMKSKRHEHMMILQLAIRDLRGKVVLLEQEVERLLRRQREITFD